MSVPLSRLFLAQDPGVVVYLTSTDVTELLNPSLSSFTLADAVRLPPKQPDLSAIHEPRPLFGILSPPPRPLSPGVQTREMLTEWPIPADTPAATIRGFVVGWALDERHIVELAAYGSVPALVVAPLMRRLLLRARLSWTPTPGRPGIYRLLSSAQLFTHYGG